MAGPTTSHEAYIRIEATGDKGGLGENFWEDEMFARIIAAYESAADACDFCQRTNLEVRTAFENDDTASSCPLDLDFIVYSVEFDQSGNCKCFF